MSTEISLIHKLTPSCLTENSRELEQLLCAEEINTDELLEKVQERDKLIQDYLSSFQEKVQDEEKKAYLNKEIEVNDKLLKVTKGHLAEQKQKLLGFVRGKNAVSRYK